MNISESQLKTKEGKTMCRIIGKLIEYKNFWHCCGMENTFNYLQMLQLQILKIVVLYLS